MYPTPSILPKLFQRVIEEDGGDEGGLTPCILSLPLPIIQSVGITDDDIPKD